jgi:hypothetical protein
MGCAAVGVAVATSVAVNAALPCGDVGFYRLATGTLFAVSVKWRWRKEIKIYETIGTMGRKR